MWWFDADGNAVANDEEIKLWGENATVECASCHNPHGTIADKDIDNGKGLDGFANDIIRPFF